MNTRIPRSASIVASHPDLEPLEPRTHLSAALGLPPPPQIFSSTPTLLAGISSTPPGGVRQIVTADFDGDGNTDIALTNTNGPQTYLTGRDLWFYRGHGDGTFDAPVVMHVNSDLSQIAAGRFSTTPTGQSDLAALGQYGSADSIYPGTVRARGYMLRVFRFDPASGGLRVAAVLAIPIAATRPYDLTQSMVVGDVTGGRQDEIALQLRGDFADDRTRLRGFVGIYGLTPGDGGAGGAGQMDRIVLKITVKDRSDYYDPSGYPAGTAFRSFDTTLQLADLDGDGKQELLFRPEHVWRAWVRAGSGGDAHNVTIPGVDTRGEVNSPLVLVTFADMNGDHKADRVTLSVVSTPGNGLGPDRFFSQVTTENGTGNGRFSAMAALPQVELYEHPYENMLTAYAAVSTPSSGQDLNGDGRADVLVYANVGKYNDRTYQSENSGVVATFSGGVGGSSFVPASPETMGGLNYAPSPNLGDINGDGLPDLIVFGSTGLVARLNIST